MVIVEICHDRTEPIKAKAILLFGGSDECMNGNTKRGVALALLGIAAGVVLATVFSKQENRQAIVENGRKLLRKAAPHSESGV
jgi:D-serine deaminase-like pyridoxal phosphate-dependent protein